LHQFLKGDTQLLIATDIASRGLDTTTVSHVILYDFPTTPIDYIHRVGRVMRGPDVPFLKDRKRVTSIITKKDRELATEIKRAIRDKRPLSK
jgi:superfamily II DNA/RNA helicase